MTCEIAIMNRQAIALAADSATTITRWVEGKQEHRFFKGSNKIFQLSNHHPVGVMIFGTAALHEVPWEVIIKDFRHRLGNSSFRGLSGYADALFDYIKSHELLYPASYRLGILKEAVAETVSMHLYLASQTDAVKTASTKEEKQKAYREHFLVWQTELDKGEYKQIDQQEIDKAIAEHEIEFQAEIDGKVLHDFELQGIIDPTALTRFAMQYLFKNYQVIMPSTSVVVAGFGDDDYFPGYEEYECYGILLGKCLHDKKGEQKINVRSPSYIKPFAVSEMINTFQLGFNRDMFERVREEVGSCLRAFATEVKAALKATEIPNEDELIKKIISEHTGKWADAALDAHHWPLRRVIGSLPVDEMAELAETLIMLESVKEKVTKPTEMVGGPIDVAVISKAEGFVWIKRKHYFDPELNPRFFQRQAASIK
jgi:hypothetical protein